MDVSLQLGEDIIYNEYGRYVGSTLYSASFANDISFFRALVLR
jgi:hypothetical protein